MKRQEYDHKKLTGNDANLKTSLKEYGIAWIETDTEYLFYYGIKMQENKCHDIDYVKFDFCAFDKNMDIKQEFDWVEWNDINNYIGMDIMDLNLPWQISDLVSYYGCENIFGSSYWEGLTYTDIVKKVKI